LDPKIVPAFEILSGKKQLAAAVAANLRKSRLEDIIKLLHYKKYVKQTPSAGKFRIFQSKSILYLATQCTKRAMHYQRKKPLNNSIPSVY